MGEPPDSGTGIITLPIIHEKVTPEHLAYFASLGVLAALEIIDWPIAIVMVAGQILAAHAHRRIVRELATGVEQAV